MIGRSVWVLLFFAGVISVQGQSLDQLLLTYSSTSDSTERFQLEEKLAWAYQNQQAYGKAVELYQRLLPSIADTLHTQHIRLNLAYCYSELGDVAGEIRTRRALLPMVSDSPIRVANLTALAALHVSVRQYDSAVLYNEQLLQLATAAKDVQLITQAYNNLGYIFQRQQNAEKSSYYFAKSYELATSPEAVMSDDDRIRILINLGVVNAGLTRIQQAQTYFEKALELSRKQRDRVKIARAINYNATTWYLRGETKKAIAVLDEGINLLKGAASTEEVDAVRSDTYKLMAELMLQRNEVSTFKLYQKKYDSLREQNLQREKRRNILLAERQQEMERQERDIQRLIAENERAKVQLVQTELTSLQRQKELEIKQNELALLKGEHELQAIRYANEQLEKARISQVLELVQQKANSAEQKQKIDLLERDKALQALSLEKSRQEIALLENTRRQESTIKEYSFIIIALLLVLLVVAVSLYFYRNKKNRLLAEQNMLINNMNQEMLATNEELSSMNEVLNERTLEVERQNDKLTFAQDIIHEQNDKLQRHARELEEEIDRRTGEIKSTNRELIRYNSQLEQFAFTVSHNLRGPIARLLGLTSLLKVSESSEREIILGMIEKSSYDLDSIIKDLAMVLDVKNTLNKLIEPVDLPICLEKVKGQAETIMSESGATVETDFSRISVVNSVPAYVESIFYNLVVNAMKYRSPKRACKVEVDSVVVDDRVEISVKDNGIGIDLKEYGDQMFKLYRRFHPQVEGKGLGLYLVKAQVEALNGRIEVESIVDVGTIFTVVLPLDGSSVKKPADQLIPM